MKFYVEALLISQKAGYTLIYTDTFSSIDEAHHAARKSASVDFRPIEYAIYDDSRRKRPLLEMTATPDGWKPMP